MSDVLNEIIKDMQKELGLSEANAEKARKLFNIAIDNRVMQEMADQAELVSAKIEKYMEEHVYDAIKRLEEGRAELLQLMMDLVNAKDAEERRSVLLRLSAATKAAAMSGPGAGGDRSAEAPDDADHNRSTITPGKSFQREQHEKQMRQAIFNAVAGSLNESQAAEFLEYTRDFDVNAHDPQGLKDPLEQAKEILFPGASPMSRYCVAVSRHVREG
jgi:hypothetical protein